MIENDAFLSASRIENTAPADEDRAASATSTGLDDSLKTKILGERNALSTCETFAASSEPISHCRSDIPEKIKFRSIDCVHCLISLRI